MSAIHDSATASPAGLDRHVRPEGGPSSGDHELLIDLLTARMPAERCAALVRAELDRAGSLRALAGEARSAPPFAGTARGELHRFVRLMLEWLRRLLREELQRGPPLTSPAETIDFLQLELGELRREVFLCLFLDTRHRVIAAESLFEGSIDGASVYPRVVAERALRHNAAAVIIAHNHPSGINEPSLADQAITRRLKDALGLLEIRLLDHFVVGDGRPVSMASRGML